LTLKPLIKFSKWRQGSSALTPGRVLRSQPLNSTDDYQRQAQRQKPSDVFGTVREPENFTKSVILKTLNDIINVDREQK
jgi:hypothetical protein